MLTIHEGRLDGSGLRIGVVAGRFNEPITDALLASALARLERLGVTDVEVARVPGAVEIPVAAQALIEGRGVDAVIAIGCVIRGDTPHFDHVCRSVVEGTTLLALDSGCPVIFCVLTVESIEQAQARSGEGPDNKGSEAALAAVEMATLLHDLQASEEQGS